MTSHRRSFFGLPLDAATQASILSEVERAVAEERAVFQASLNAAKVVHASTDAELAGALDRFDLVTADGQAVVWAARALRMPVPERVAGIDLMLAIVARAAEMGWRVYLLGATPEILERTANKLRRLHPELTISGRRDGYFAAAEEPDVVRDIRDSASDILFVALGSPDKELFLDRHRSELGVAFGMGVGGAFDVIAGARARAPRWLQRVGLEWAFRLAQDPLRLGRRYVSSNGRFVAMVGREAVAVRRRGRPV
jgi:N-acetylglucosaminyldiphosphoundecaprenol N-acetyl-beta-D-mannosaminyltransferase